MPLKYAINSLDDVPGPHRALYAKADDGRYLLALEGEPPGYVKAGKLDEFRNTNRALNAKVTELSDKLKAFEGIDPAADDSAEFEALEAKLKAFDGIDPAEHQSLRALVPRVAELEATLATERAATAKAAFTNAVSVAFLKHGGRESAVDYMVAMAEKVFTLKDGTLTSSAFSELNPGEPLSLDEWLANQHRAMDFAFKPSTGAGVRPTPTGSVPGRVLVDRHDPVEFGKNLAAIASGNAIVNG